MEVFTNFQSVATVFHIDAHRGIKVELFGDFSKMDGTILSIKPPGQEPTFILTANNNTEVCAQKSGVALDWPGIFTNNHLFWIGRKSHSRLGETKPV